MGYSLLLRCNNCTFSVQEAMIQAYVVDASGKRIHCRHPGQDENACEILGISHDHLREAMKESRGHRNGTRRYELPDGMNVTAYAFVDYFESRCGILRNFLCTYCGRLSELDDRKDRMQCMRCGSEAIFSLGHLEGRVCPICKMGRLGSA